MLKKNINVSSLLDNEELIDFQLPNSDLLEPGDYNEHINYEELNLNASILKETLEKFNITIGEISITSGPVVSLYEFVPAFGIKFNEIERIQDHINLAIKSSLIRIVGPMPGCRTIGIEIQNHTRKIVLLSQIVKDPDFIASQLQLPIGIGMTISGEIYIADLAKMPHLLIGGSSGTEITDGINTIITSLLYHKKPDELKFILIDSKKDLLSQYKTLNNHYLATSLDVKDLVISEPIDVLIILKNTISEMHKRYKNFQKLDVRNILEYNSKVDSGLDVITNEITHKKIPYLVVIINDLADLMELLGKEFELNLVSLTQMARAVGIHLVVATERPSTNAITELIKANFPARLAYQVPSLINSRIILDQGGAEKLLGYGDMLYLPGNKPYPERIQNAYISNEEIVKVCKFIEDQKEFSSPYLLPNHNQIKNGDIDRLSPESRDESFEDVARYIIRTQKANRLDIQRKFCINFARFNRIVKELEELGVIGTKTNLKASVILMESESELEEVLECQINS